MGKMFDFGQWKQSSKFKDAQKAYAAVPFQSCAMYGEIVVISGNSRQSYSKYQIPETIYLPQYFQMSIDNASDKFTTIIKIIDKKTGNVVSVREVGPNSYDMIQN